ncbi:MAG TPA: UDP-N-acetylmuramoyl-tripeptide--D-alanyl-D-alanine ligase [Propionibacteriaceae bacterium]|nr:UDP-N-acetylmuramoyl-tripeptide--D-alanyl-D-alanine ligase [Propionibacteriaceae bacterium]
MDLMTTGQLATITGGRLVGTLTNTPIGPDVVIDTRAATPGCLFVALPGEHVDGHDFTQQAADAHAGAVLGSRETTAPLPHVVVDDPVAGLSALARHVVASAEQLTVLAITGSSGKTSTKDLLAQVLESDAPTVSPVGSFNNEIGVPLTACKVDATTRYLVSEMGARGLGHIAWLCSIAAPDISMVINVGTAHMGEFGSRDVIAQAKGEIIEALSPQGWAVLNADDPLVAAMSTRTTGRVAWFAVETEPPAGAALSVRAVDVEGNDLQQFSFTLRVSGVARPSESHPVHLQVMGRHQVANAAAAAAAAVAAGLTPVAVAQALSAATTRSRWRMELVRTTNGAAIINDAYNANPDSMAAAVSTLAEVATARRAQDPACRAIAILGDMLELGPDSASLHEEVGRQVARAGIDELISVGEFSADMVRGAEALGASARAMTVERVAEWVDLAPSDVVLVKASRGIGLERVADELVRRDARSGEQS